MVRLLLALIVVLLLPCAVRAYVGPEIFLWVWSYDQNLRWLQSNYSIAYLAGTIRLGKCGLKKIPRQTELKISHNHKMEAVVRIEVEPGYKVDLKEVPLLVKAVISLLPSTKLASAQIDFDAKVSQRQFYKAFIAAMNNALGHSLDINITALASWLTFDRWTKDLPVKHTTPMLFRMGTKSEILRYLERPNSLMHINSLGLAKDEVDVVTSMKKGNNLKNLSLKRIYLFSPTPWLLNNTKAVTTLVEDEFRTSSR